jgi:hypothetical protein
MALYNHMLGEEPGMFSLHYWGAGKAENLA